MIQQNTTENNIDSKKGSSKKSSIVSKMLVSLTGVATLTVLQLFNIQPLQYFENLNLTTTTTTTMTMTDIATIINDNTTEENFRNISSNLPIKELKTARKDKKNKKKKTNGVPMIPTTYDRNDNSTDNDTITYTNALKSTSFSCNYKRKRRGSSEQVCQCHVVHDVCIDHNNQKDIPYVWYYKYTNNSYYHQQNVNITIKQKKYRLNSFRVEHHLHSNKTAWPSSSSLSTKNNNCVESPIPNHMIVTDAYMEMIGEFYLSGYRKLMNIYVNLSKEDQLQFSTTTQLYLPTSKFLTSHETFLGLFTKHEVLSYLSFLQYGSNNNTNNNNNNNNTNRTSCTCLQHLYYCGSRESSKLIDTKANNRNNRKIKKLELSEIQQHTRSSAVSRPTLLTRPQFRRQLIQNHINRNSQQQQHQHGENNTNNNNNDYQTFIRNNNNRRGVVIDESEYKIIGLTQRSSRRKWLGLDEIIHECNRRWFHHHHYHHHQSRTNNTSTTTTTTTTTTKNSTNKVLCVEVNLETATISTPELQILWHTSMDGLVGIHGAQLTHAVFLPSHSLVVELLPWVMKGIVMGAWTKTVTAYVTISYMYRICICIGAYVCTCCVVLCFVALRCAVCLFLIHSSTIFESSISVILLNVI